MPYQLYESTGCASFRFTEDRKAISLGHLDQYQATSLLVDREWVCRPPHYSRPKSIAFRRNTSCLFTLVVLCIVSTISPIMATNKMRRETKNPTE